MLPLLLRSDRTCLLLLVLVVTGCLNTRPDDRNNARLHPYAENPHYLAWGETPIFPLGATGYHSWTPISRPGTMNFESQLDRLAQVINEIGSSHVRGFVRALPYDPMNHMHDGPVAEVLQPWVQLEEGRYDLERFAPAWENRLRAFLDAALERQIIVSLELWDDWSVTRGPEGAYDPGEKAGWNAHPFNPRNNVNYDEDVLPASTAACNAPFYSTVPSRDNIEQVLDLQKRYVDRVLRIASAYPHVLINVSNESRAHLDWSHFWAEYARDRLPETMMIGEMPSSSREDDRGQCEPAFNPQTLSTDFRYDFVDVAQAVSGHSFDSFREQALGGGKRISAYRKAMTEAYTAKPLLVTKDYARASEGGNVVLWGRFTGGAAAARFHRLGADHGEEVIAFQHEAIRRLGQFIADVPFWRMHPAPNFVSDLPDEAGVNVLAEPGGHAVIQLLGGREGQRLSLNVTPGAWVAQWIDPATGQKDASYSLTARQSPLAIEIPAGREHQILHLKPESP